MRLKQDATVYEAPDPSSPVISTLTTGDVIILDQSDPRRTATWDAVSLSDGRKGYVSAKTKAQTLEDEAVNMGLGILFIGTVVCACLFFFMDWDAGVEKFRALEAGQVSEVKADPLTVWAYRLFGINGVLALKFAVFRIVPFLGMVMGPVGFWRLLVHQRSLASPGAPPNPINKAHHPQVPPAGMGNPRAADDRVHVDIKELGVPQKEQPKQEPSHNCRYCRKPKQCTPVAFILARHLSTTKANDVTSVKFSLVERYEIPLCADCRRLQYFLRLRSVFLPFLILLASVLALYWVATKLLESVHYGYIVIPTILMVLALPLAGITLINFLRAIFLKSTTIEEAAALLCHSEIGSRHNLSTLGTRFGIDEMQPDNPTEFVLFTAHDWKAKFNIS